MSATTPVSPVSWGPFFLLVDSCSVFLDAIFLPTRGEHPENTPPFLPPLGSMLQVDPSVSDLSLSLLLLFCVVFFFYRQRLLPSQLEKKRALFLGFFQSLCLSLFPSDDHTLPPPRPFKETLFEDTFSLNQNPPPLEGILRPQT